MTRPRRFLSVAVALTLAWLGAGTTAWSASFWDNLKEGLENPTTTKPGEEIKHHDQVKGGRDAGVSKPKGYVPTDFEPDEEVVVAVLHTWIWSQPNPFSERLASLKKGAKIKVLGRLPKPNEEWHKVQAGQVEGFTHGSGLFRVSEYHPPSAVYADIARQVAAKGFSEVQEREAGPTKTAADASSSTPPKKKPAQKKPATDQTAQPAQPATGQTASAAPRDRLSALERALAADAGKEYRSFRQAGQLAEFYEFRPKPQIVMARQEKSPGWAKGIERALAQPGTLTGELGKKMTPEEEDMIGRISATQDLAGSPSYGGGRTALERYVDEIGQTLALASDYPVPYRGRYLFGVVKDNRPMAVSYPGGYVLVSTGALALCRDEDELAGLLAHEISHNVRRHNTQAVLDLARVKTMNQVTGGDLMRNYGQLVELAKLGYDRDTEHEADAVAVGILTRVGYDPEGLRRLLARLAQDYQPGRGVRAPNAFSGGQDAASASRRGFSEVQEREADEPKKKPTSTPPSQSAQPAPTPQAPAQPATPAQPTTPAQPQSAQAKKPASQRSDAGAFGQMYSHHPHPADRVRETAKTIAAARASLPASSAGPARSRRFAQVVKL